MERFLKMVLVICLVAFAILIAIGMYGLARDINHQYSYGAKVESDICRMVKPEYLKEPCE